jgi:hypothetical protein
MLQVCAPRITENQDVKEHKNEYSDEVLKDAIHECLERCRCTG